MKELPMYQPSAQLPAPNSAEGERMVVRIAGMDCASCAQTLERFASRVTGVQQATVHFSAARMDIVHDGSVTDQVIERAVVGAGFTVVSAVGLRSASGPWQSLRARASLLAAACWLVGLGLHFATDTALINLTQTALFVAAIVLAGIPMFRAAVAGLRVRHLDMNVLMGTAVIGAAIIGQWGEAAAVVVLFSIGQTLQTISIDRTRRAVTSLAELTPSEVLVKRGDMAAAAMRVEDIIVGDLMIVRPGERVAVDGRIVEGASTLDESPITGESIPVEKMHGDAVLSGSLNGAGSITVLVEQTAATSTLQRIAQLVEQAQATRAPAELFIDRFSRIYTPVVVLSAAAFMVIPSLLVGDVSQWVYRGLALLIIACPCALVISIPVSVVSGIGAASRLGILVKGGAALEHAGKLTALALDKTGTLTEGRPTVVSVMALAQMSEDAVTILAAALERRSEHPLAHAILTAAGDHPLPDTSHFTSIPGRGATARIDGRQYVIGSPRMIDESDIELPEAVSALIAKSEGRGETVVILAREQQVLGVFALADTIRADAPDSIRRLRDAGIDEIVMLTGDNDGAARRVATELGISYRAGLRPEDKIAAINDLLDTNTYVGMVGDGINDTPALATASVSFAMGAAGTGAALEAADITLMNDDLRRLADAVGLSRRVNRIIRQNVVVSLLVKSVFVVLAPFGLVTLWMAVAADLGTSLAVTANGLRLFGKR